MIKKNTFETFRDFVSYEGWWKNGQFHGYGTRREQDGKSWFHGWTDGKPSGWGSYVNENRKFRWVCKINDNGQCHGPGVNFYENILMEEGIWKDGEFIYPRKVNLPDNTELYSGKPIDIKIDPKN